MVGAESIIGGAPTEAPQPQGQLLSTSGAAIAAGTTDVDIAVVPQQSVGAGLHVGAGGGHAGAHETAHGSGAT